MVGPIQLEPPHVLVGIVIQAHAFKPASVTYCPVTLPLVQSQYVPGVQVTGPPLSFGSWLERRQQLPWALGYTTYWTSQIGVVALVGYRETGPVPRAVGFRLPRIGAELPSC